MVGAVELERKTLKLTVDNVVYFLTYHFFTWKWSYVIALCYMERYIEYMDYRVDRVIYSIIFFYVLVFYFVINVAASNEFVFYVSL